MQSGDWDSIKAYRKGFKPSPGRLQDNTGQLVESSQRADTLATYFETVQWCGNWEPLQPGDIPSHIFGHNLNISVGEFTNGELKAAIDKTKRNKSSGSDDVPAEIWKALSENPLALDELLRICNLAWVSKQIPKDWKHADVVILFKKGNTQLPSNYRPISLLCVAYKILASMMLERLRDGGCEDYLRQTQFGFRAKRSTSQAIFMAKRLIDRALDTKNGKLSIILLDWAKAFDRIRPEAMLRALKRFGIPSDFIEIISAIYSDRTFSITDCGVTSSTRSTHG